MFSKSLDERPWSDLNFILPDDRRKWNIYRVALLLKIHQQFEGKQISRNNEKTGFILAYIYFGENDLYILFICRVASKQITLTAEF